MDMALTILCWVATNLVNCHSVRKRAGLTSPPYPPRSRAASLANRELSRSSTEHITEMTR
jgi:hypothetical protein